MKINSLLHNISYLKWLFLLWAVVLILYAFIRLPDNILSITGTIIFLIGIYLGLDSLSDISRISEKEKARFKQKNFAKIQGIIVLSAIGILSLISILFLSSRIFLSSKDPSVADPLFKLGLDCLVFILGLLCLLKSIHEKNAFVETTDTNEEI